MMQAITKGTPIPGGSVYTLKFAEGIAEVRTGSRCSLFSGLGLQPMTRTETAAFIRKARALGVRVAFEGRA